MARTVAERADTRAHIPDAARVRTAGAVLAASILLAATLLNGRPAAAQVIAALPPASPSLGRGGPIEPIRGWVDLCRRLPAECTLDRAERRVITLSADVWQMLASANAEVNERIKPMVDRDHWGVEDRWDHAEDGRGDCEDFQLLKRRLLVERGLPRRALLMTVVLDEAGDGHAVLMARTDRGDFILDNRTTRILPWDATGYVYVKREGQDGSAWVSLQGARSPVATANP